MSISGRHVGGGLLEPAAPPEQAAPSTVWSLRFEVHPLVGGPGDSQCDARNERRVISKSRERFDDPPLTRGAPARAYFVQLCPSAKQVSTGIRQFPPG